MPNVPNNESFSLLDVYNSVHGHAAGTATNLSSCFSNAVTAYFDPSYNQISYAPVNSMKRFRNYTIPSLNPATISMSLTPKADMNLRIPSAGVYVYDGVLTIVSPIAQIVGVKFDLDFLSGSIPLGQVEQRGAILSIIFPNNITGAGTIATYSKTCVVGTNTVPFTITYKNENWDSPRPISSFRLRLGAVSNAILSVPNSTTTNGTTHVVSLEGIKTLFYSVTFEQSGNFYSGEMIYYKFLAIVPSGDSLTKFYGYRDPIVMDSFNTDSYSVNKEFVFTYLTSEKNTMGAIYTHGDTMETVIPLATPPGYTYVRFSLLNHSGSSATYSFTRMAYKYCSFTEINYSQSILPLTATGKHKLYLPTFSGDLDFIPDSVTIVPGVHTLNNTDTFSYKLVAHCPTGGYIYLRSTGGPDVDLLDTNEFSISASPYVITENIPFNSLSTYANTYIATGFVRGSMTINFTQVDQYIEFVPTSSNITIESPYMIDSNGFKY